MAKRHQASRRKAYGRRQHELRERFDRSDPRADDAVRVEVYETAAYDDAGDVFASFDLAAASGLRYALRD
jgi:hypothetical protein